MFVEFCHILAPLVGEKAVAGPATTFDYDNDGLLDIFIGYFGNYVEGTLRYRENGSDIEVPLTSVGITVLPQPELGLDYFWQRDVMADDPWTSCWATL